MFRDYFKAKDRSYPAVAKILSAASIYHLGHVGTYHLYFAHQRGFRHHSCHAHQPELVSDWRGRGRCGHFIYIRAGSSIAIAAGRGVGRVCGRLWDFRDRGGFINMTPPGPLDLTLDRRVYILHLI